MTAILCTLLLLHADTVVVLQCDHAMTRHLADIRTFIVCLHGPADGCLEWHHDGDGGAWRVRGPQRWDPASLDEYADEVAAEVTYACTIPPQCLRWDGDNDFDVDLADFALFQQHVPQVFHVLVISGVSDVTAPQRPADVGDGWNQFTTRITED